MDFQNKIVRTKLIELIPIEKNDIEFIYELRTKRKNNFLKKISNNIEDQYIYFNEYYQNFLNGNEIYYKIIDKKKQKKIGLVRILDLKNKNKINWASLITIDNAPIFTAPEVCFTIYKLAFEVYKVQSLGPGNYKKNNKKISLFHQKMGFITITHEDSDYVYFDVNLKKYNSRKYYFNNLGFGQLF